MHWQLWKGSRYYSFWIALVRRVKACNVAIFHQNIGKIGTLQCPTDVHTSTCFVVNLQHNYADDGCINIAGQTQHFFALLMIMYNHPTGILMNTPVKKLHEANPQCSKHMFAEVS
jgi:hypothetical protein